MAINASRISSGRGDVIDLTGIDDEEEEEAPVTNGFQRRPPPTGPNGSSHSLLRGQHDITPPVLVSTTTRAPSVAISKSIERHITPARPAHTNRFSQSLPLHSQLQERPSKRRKLQGHDRPNSASPATDTKALTKCLQTQVFPHLDRAVKNIDRELYNVEKLGSRIIGRIADSEFEQHFHQGNGRLLPNVEVSVAKRISDLLAEFTKGNEFRRSPAALIPPPNLPREPELQPTASVLHSIEYPSNEVKPTRDDDEVKNEDDEEVQIDGGSFEDLDAPEEDEPERIQTPLRQPKKKTAITPQQLRIRKKAAQWQSGRTFEFKRERSPLQVTNRWFGLSSRPYLPAGARQQITAGVGKGRLFHLQSDELRQPTVYHVDFTNEEVWYLRHLARSLYGRPAAKSSRPVMRDLRHLVKKTSDLENGILDAHRRRYSHLQQPPSSLLKRSEDDIHNFLGDLRLKHVNPESKSLYMERDDADACGNFSRVDKVPSVLLAREITGNRLGGTRDYGNFTTTFKSSREDHLEPKVEWTNCAGDIMTFSWLNQSKEFVCGTTTHSDSHNQQYNKPGNLLFGSIESNKLSAYPHHRIVRPRVEHGDNALESMRESQDPWLYTSVVSSDYDPWRDVAFTSSFDNTVKVWAASTGSRVLRETWRHDGRVNFVVTNKDEQGSKVATAADVPTKAVRVYESRWDGQALTKYTYNEFSCKRVHGEDYVPSDKWAYFPSAIRWGVAPSMSHLLLVGYSPRSLNGDDNEIPEDRRDTGELCLWDTNANTEVKVNSAATSNVFEVAWHPSRPSFAAATSATQTSEKIEEHVRTQIRLFELNGATGQYTVIKTLDCPAIDINELLIRPNSILYSYVAAGCTDGRVYVWDSARGEDDPMCVLEHGDPVEEFIGDREHEDVGVKFIAWATTHDRLYTGSSDGAVKVWNIRHDRGVLVRDLIEVGAPITVGAFSPDFTKLLIGDGSGRVYLMDLEDDEESDNQNNSAAVSSGFLKLQLDGKQRAIRRPRPFIPHEEPPRPEEYIDPDFFYEYEDHARHAIKNPYQAGQERAKEFLNMSQLTLHPDPTIGAVQGPDYAGTGLYRAEAHLGGDANEPLLSAFEGKQRMNQRTARKTRFRRQRAVGKLSLALWEQHKRNARLDLDISSLSRQARSKLMAEKAELDVSPMDLDYDSCSGYEED
ncbi:WD40 repeat-like protein [Hypoxylon sp. NC1633]|nr:WD40 repeat-like protein [Hypoxylon sp. NC1633]